MVSPDNNNPSAGCMMNPPAAINPTANSQKKKRAVLIV